MDDVVLQTWRDSGSFSSDAKRDGDVFTMANSFVHGAGMYTKPDIDPLLTREDPFYHPMFAEKFDANDRSYQCLNWGPVVTPSINRGEIMMYSSYRHLGGNVLEVTFYGYNFGDNTYDDIALPWAMFRHSVFSRIIKSMPNGDSFELFEGYYPTRFDIADAGGWVGKTADVNDPNALSITTVHGLDKHLGNNWQSRKTICSVGTSPVENSTRDISIMTAFNNSIEVGPGEGFYKRFYFVLGKQSEVIEKSYDLVDDVEYGFLEFEESSTGLLPLYASTINGQNIITSEKPNANSSIIASTYAMPVKNSIPLFLMKNNNTGQYYLSTDPYALCSKEDFVLSGYNNRHIYKPYDGKTDWVAMLGYVMPSSKATVTANTATLSSIIGNNYQFTAGEKYTSNQVLIRTDDIGTPTTPINVEDVYEAEDAGISSASVKTNNEASGGEYVDGNEDFVLSFEVSKSGEATLEFRIKTPVTNNSRSMGVYVNGTKTGTVTTLLTDWNHKSVTATLSGGINTIELRDSEGTSELDVDYLKVITTGSSFTPDPNKFYYIDAPYHDLRLASTGESEDAYTTSTTDTSNDTKWKFVQNSNGYWHVQRAAGGSVPRLRTDNSEFADMQGTAWSGTYTYYEFTEGYIDGTYFFTLPEGPTAHQRLQINNKGAVRFVPTSHALTWESFTITEVQNSSLTGNIAVNGIATQSSTAYGGDASRAIDGNTNGVYNNASVTHTEANTNAWWQVDLGSSQSIGSVVVWNRTDSCCTSRLSNFKIQVLDNNGNVVYERELNDFTPNPTYTTYPNGTLGRYVRVELTEPGTLSLAEVQVFGSGQSNKDVLGGDKMSDVVIYPNPAIATASIQGAQGSILEIYDMKGVLVLTKNISSEVDQIDMNNLSSGIYYAKITSLQSVDVIKVIKN